MTKLQEWWFAKIHYFRQLMYIPTYYQNQDLDQVRSFLIQNSFGILINQVDGRLWGSHIPMELSKNAKGQDVLEGHVSRANPQGGVISNGGEVLAIFTGPHAYVSSSWYGHENVPTWNYIAIHIYGTIRVLTEEELYQSLKHLVDKYETHSETPVSMEGFSEKTLKQMRGVVGFQIQIEEIQAAQKLSQNRNPEDYTNIIKELEKRDDTGSNNIASAMRKLRT